MIVYSSAAGQEEIQKGDTKEGNEEDEEEEAPLEISNQAAAME